ncbi:MAG: hypothetical protein OEU95_03535 [Nitrospirota bacterium]|nr:hypothetical protein [Nitrospirota bacterium]
MARKIKKRPESDRKKPVMQERERQAVFAATFAVMIVDLLLLIAVFPGLDSMIVSSAGSGGAAALKTIIIVVVDIALFISVFMILSRRRKKQDRK